MPTASLGQRAHLAKDGHSVSIDITLYVVELVMLSTVVSVDSDDLVPQL